MTTTQTETNGVRGRIVLPSDIGWPAVRARLQEAMHRKILSQRALAKAAHISQGGLSEFLSGKNEELELETLAAIAMALDVTVEAMAGIEPAPVRLVPFDEIGQSTLNPRTNFDAEKIDGLADNIAADSLLQPLLVRPREGGGYLLVAGERRWHAIRKLRAAGTWPADRPVACTVRDDLDNEGHLTLALAENIQREDLSPLEEAAAFRKLMVEFDWNTERIAAHFGKTQRWVQQRLSLLDLGNAARAAIADGVFGAAVGRIVATLKDHKAQQAVVDRIREGVLLPHETRVRTHVNEILSRPKHDRQPAATDGDEEDDGQMDIEDLAPGGATERRPHPEEPQSGVSKDGDGAEAADLQSDADGGAREPEHPASPNENGVYEREQCEAILGPVAHKHVKDCEILVVCRTDGRWDADCHVACEGIAVGAFMYGALPGDDGAGFDTRRDAVHAVLYRIAADAAGKLAEKTIGTVPRSAARAILAWANMTLPQFGGEPVPEPAREIAAAKASHPNPDFTPPPPEDRMRAWGDRPHAGVEALTAPILGGDAMTYELAICASPIGASGWPASVVVRDKRDNATATYRLERVRAED